jgi:hypothetical protein
MTIYVRQMSAGEIIRGALELYKNNFTVLFLTFLVAIIPPNLFVRPFVSAPFGLAIFFIVTFLCGFIAYAAIAIAISDVCTGNRPSVGRSYKYIFGKPLVQLLLVSLLQILVVFAGSLLLLIPGLILGAWFMFAPVIVVLERTGAVAGMKRSKFLGKGFYLRNFGLLFLIIILLFLAMFMIGFLGGAAILVFKIPSAQGFVIGLLTLLGSAIFYPYVYTALILMYYDLRARREGYDSTALTEDLLR